MTWNYRVMRHVAAGDEYFEIHEVYYDKDGKVTNWTENSVVPFGETVDVLRENLKAFASAFEKPVLDYE